MKRSYAKRVLVTGGPFDKEYNELNGTLFFKDTHVQEMLRLGRSRVEVTVQTLLMMDSLDMTEVHRSQIVDAFADRRKSDGHAQLPRDVHGAIQRYGFFSNLRPNSHNRQPAGYHFLEYFAVPPVAR